MAKRWYYKDANGNKVPVPQYKINADDYYTKTMSDSRYYDKSATDTLLGDKVSKSDIVQSTGTSTTAVMSQKAVSDSINKLKNAGYLYAGISTPTTNPGAQDGPVFYIASTAGNYPNFGNIEISKGESAILKWNNGIWTKNTFKPMTDFNSVFDANGNSLTHELKNLSLQKESVVNKAQSLSTPNDTDYPTTKAVADAIKTAIWGDYDEVCVSDGFIFYTPNREKRIYTGVNILATNNIFNISDIVRGKRCNDSGNIVSDTAEGYTENFIPVRPGFWLKTNIITIDNIYYYDQNYNFIKRLGNGVSLSGRGTQIESNVYFVKLQVRLSKLDANPQTMVILHDGSTTPTFGSFVEFKSNKDGNVYEGEPNMVWADGYVPFSYKVQKEKSNDVITREPLFADMSLWEPDDVDSGYSNPSSGYGQDTKREDWSASDKYMYYDFLAHYYDGYLGETDGYRVTRRSLCQDTAHTGHEIFEYDFCPKDYKCVVMLSAGMNADETQGIWGLATFIRCLMNEEEPMLAIAKKNIRFKVIPIINASGFDQPLLRYGYANGVNPNYNFNFKDSWSKQTKAGKGDYPDSNIETQALKKWINDNAGAAIWWHDIHTGTFGDTLNSKILDLRFPTEEMYGDFNNTIAEEVCTYYKAKGYVDSSKTKWDTGYAQSLSLTNYDYSKHFYAYHICGIPNCMSEMHIESTGYGADGRTNNSTYGIKSYVLQIRILMMFMVNKWMREHPSITLQDEKFGRLQQIFK